MKRCVVLVSPPEAFVCDRDDVSCSCSCSDSSVCFEISKTSGGRFIVVYVLSRMNDDDLYIRMN